MAYLTMKQLLESGVHFGHQTKRWNPKMKQYIYCARNGIYIIDLQQTVRMFRTAYDYIKDVAARGGTILFVGTKKQAQNSIADEAARCDMFYVNNRWVGGFLTNFKTVKNSIKRLNDLDDLSTSNPEFADATKKELVMLGKEKERLEKYLGGVREMTKNPDLLFVIDAKKEEIAIKEANRLGIPVVAVVDTNCDPDNIDYVIPGNDDAIRAIKLFATSVADACLEGRQAYEEGLQAARDKEAAKAAPAPEAKASEEAAPAEEAPAAEAKEEKEPGKEPRKEDEPKAEAAAASEPEKSTETQA